MARLQSLSPSLPVEGKFNGSGEALSPASKLIAHMVASFKKKAFAEESVKKLSGLKCKQSDETFGLHVLIFFILSSVGEKNVSSDEEEDIIGPAPPAATVRT